MSEHDTPVQVEDHPAGGHIDAIVDGATAGAAYYRVVDGRVIVNHTEVREQYEGRGVGTALARALLARIRADGQQIVPLCPFFAGYIERHPEWSDLVDRDTYDRLRA